ncbi:hypothetical protein PVA44_07400 (plasmid) [Entomospira nematocerorum]|nr:hypothetical protein [Entomospira nematocera]NIZ47735.1 hypothetical protein [Entomospira nematocera]WDI34662.1 hypothetical protein PVA44_07400 [Entomospira nematocera]
MDDAEKCLDKILQADILGENNERKSVMKLIQLKLDTENRDEIASIDTHLGRGGLALMHLDTTTLALAIHTNSDAIRYMLKNSSYASSYASILRRHENCIESHYRTQKTKVAGLKPTFILLDLQSIIVQQPEE